MVGYHFDNQPHYDRYVNKQPFFYAKIKKGMTNKANIEQLFALAKASCSKIKNFEKFLFLLKYVLTFLFFYDTIHNRKG